MKPIMRLIIEIQQDGLYRIEAASHGLTAEALCREEALGCIASWIYRSRDDGSVPQFMITELTQAKNNRRFNRMSLRDRAVLVEAGEPLEEPERGTE